MKSDVPLILAVAILLTTIAACQFEKKDPQESAQMIRDGLVKLESALAVANTTLAELKEKGLATSKQFHELQGWAARLSREITMNRQALAEWEANQAAREARVARGELTQEESNRMGWLELLGALGGTAISSVLASLGITWKLRGSPYARRGASPPPPTG